MKELFTCEREFIVTKDGQGYYADEYDLSMIETGVEFELWEDPTDELNYYYHIINREYDDVKVLEREWM